ncbi:hypothetical protein ANN_22331 [Periplaneta americana]|uniref:BPL/LPL catalytic domain-containing protein n=1 Tax=Periplaneta americana TaxID=6978 RepID=A0ABQ8S7Y7_PERAM|nr:hypothetical protein ANN_22331 [Periplaneta americana]
MAQNLIQGSISKFCRIAVTGVSRKNTPVLYAVKVGNFSTSQPSSEKVKDSETVKSVFISQSSDIFTNLALEDWLYRNFDFTNHHILLLWRNSPTVVIGRHQNPWLEANTALLSEHGIEIARRNSGGGTVYHDKGNLNLTFFTPREAYNRKNNLELISRALFREWGLKTEISPREDIVVNGNYKVRGQQISGTASKLGRPNAYHHCTLLVDVNKVNLSQALHKHDKHTRLKVYKTLARPVLTYGSEAWTIRKADEQRLMTAEMRFMRRTAGCSLLEHRKNVDILQELKMDPIVNFVQQYRLQWKKHVERMDRTRWLKQILTYVPRGKRKLGRPRKRWHETITDPVGSNT